MAGFVKKRLHQFCQKTSVKGIPRILRTKSYFMRTIWTISVTCFLAIAVYLSFLLLSDYLEYRSVTSLREYNIDVSGSSSDSVRLPDITLCNMNPFSISTYNMTDVLSLEHYHKKVLSVTVCHNCTVDETKTMEELRTELLTTSGYYIHIESKAARRVSHKKEAFIASCHISILSGMHPRRVPCDDIVEIQNYYDYMYYNCFTLKVAQPTSRDLYHGMILVLQLNNKRDIIEQQQFLTPHIIPGQTSGAVMLLHQQDQLPMMTRNNIHLPSGFFTSLRLRYQRRIRLPKPYGTCKKTAEREGDYQQAMCFSICVQTLILRTCGCIDFTNYNDFFGLVAKLSVSPCLSLKTTEQMLHQNWKCVQEMRLNATMQCKDTCPIPCEEMAYHYDLTYAPWPTSPYHSNFYERYIAGRTYEREFTSLRNRAHSQVNAHEFESANRLVSQNFLAMQLDIDEQLMMEYEARPQLSLTSFLSQLGGALNLWAGITVVILVEIFELFYHLLVDFRKEQTQQDEQEQLPLQDQNGEAKPEMDGEIIENLGGGAREGSGDDINSIEGNAGTIPNQQEEGERTWV